jgi:hypothetical protein
MSHVWEGLSRATPYMDKSMDHIQKQGINMCVLQYTIANKT